MPYRFGGFSKVGFKRENNEVFLLVKELGSNLLLSVIADGAGSEPSNLQPAQLASRKVADMITRIYDDGNNKYVSRSSSSKNKCFISKFW